MSLSKGVTPTGSGHSPKGGAASASPAEPSVPNAVQQLRDNADSLNKWFKSMDEQRRDWTYHHGVEVEARDALEAVYRIAVSVVAGLQQAASAIEAATAAGTAQTGPAEGESAVGATSAGTP